MSVAIVRGPGEPDQACEAVAAAVAEEYVRRDPASQVNVRASGGRGVLFVAGEVASAADFDVSAVVRRALGQAGVSSVMEPFIAMEPLVPAWAPAVGARESVSVIGYATSETPDRFPKAVSIARDAARELERRRSSDPEWFWLGADFTVTVNDAKAPTVILIRAEHVESVHLTDVRARLSALLDGRHPGCELRINPAGEETKAGLASRVGSSGSRGAGRHVRHPLNLGAWMVRAIALDLIRQGKGKAVRIEATWWPLESRPQHVSVRNERGENLSALVPFDRLDLAKAPDAFLSPHLLSATLAAPYDGSILLPWESEDGML